jgi:hypothetical protein
MMALANGGQLPTRQQAMKLVAEAWENPIQSIDVTFYASIRESDKSELDIRKQLEKKFRNIHGLKGELSPKMLEQQNRMIEMNVVRILKEQQIGRKMKVRIRKDSKRQRTDMVFGKPEVTTFAGTEKEKRLQGKTLSDSTPFEITNVYVTDEGRYTHFEYLHKNKTATIKTALEPDRTLRKSNILKVLGMPEEVSTLLQRLLGKKEITTSGEVYLPDQAKINKLCSSGTMEDKENVSIRVFSEKDTGHNRDRIEISFSDEESKSEMLKMTMVCDIQDYSKVYDYELRDLVSNQPVIKRVCSNFGPDGFPSNSTETKYDNDGNIEREITHRVVSVRLNVPIPDDVFEFNPPKDYTVNDLRLTQDERGIQEIARMKEWLDHEKWTDRMRALARLEDLLKYNPEELKNIATSMLGDEHSGIRAKALIMLERLLRDNPAQLHQIADLLRDDEDPKIREIIKRILYQSDSNK